MCQSSEQSSLTKHKIKFLFLVAYLESRLWAIIIINIEEQHAVSNLDFSLETVEAESGLEIRYHYHVVLYGALFM